MAKVKAPLFSEEARGALAGIEFRNNRSGNLVGRRSITPYKLTPKQAKHRTLLSTARTRWNALSQKDQDSWKRIATDLISPRTAFTRAWLLLSKSGFIPITHCGAPQPFDDIKNIIISVLPAPSNQILLQWSHTTGRRLQIQIFSAPSWSFTPTPTRSKLRYTQHAQTTDNFAIVTLAAKAPRAHLLLRLVDTQQGTVRQEHMLVITTAW